MDVLNTLLLITILIIVLVNNSSVNGQLQKLRNDLNLLLKHAENTPLLNTEKKKPSKVETFSDEETKVAVEDRKSTILPEPLVTEIPSTQPKEIFKEQPLKIENKKDERIFSNISGPTKPKVKGDLEKFIGENLMSKIGILILVLGVGYFVKYAIDKDYINEFGRTAIGILTGGALIVLAHRMRKNYKTFASILIGGGLAILYTTITIAYQLYALFPQSVAFVFLIVITFFAVLLALLYDKKELAIFSLIGGFASPFMVKSGEGNYIVLFSYLLLLNAGMLAISWYKRWHILNILGYLFTLLLFGGWLADEFVWTNSSRPYAGALAFASAFYIVFFLVNVLNNIRKFQAFNSIEIGMILSNNLFYFLGGLLILNTFQNGIYKGLFTAILGIYNFLWVLYLYKKQQIDRTFIFLLIGLVLSFISLAIPIQLDGHSITLFWAAETVILIWISQVSGIKLLKSGHIIILVLTLISLLIDWSNNYHISSHILPVFFNKACITGLVVIVALVFSIYFLRKEKETDFIRNIIDVKTYGIILSALIVIGLYSVLMYELWYQMNRFSEVSSYRQAVYAVFNFNYIAVFVLISRWQKWYKIEKIIYFLSLFMLFVFMIFYSSQIIRSRIHFLNYHDITEANYLFHYLVYPAVIGIIAFIIKKREEVLSSGSTLSKLVLWYIMLVIVVTTSFELDNIVLHINYANSTVEYSLIKHVHRIGYPILWACLAFITMVIGMKFKNKVYRIQAISLLGLIIIKLLFVDVWQMDAGGRIATFIFLGVILLVISFLYQKLKQFILEEEEKND